MTRSIQATATALLCTFITACGAAEQIDPFAGSGKADDLRPVEAQHPRDGLTMVRRGRIGCHHLQLEVKDGDEYRFSVITDREDLVVGFTDLNWNHQDDFDWQALYQMSGDCVQPFPIGDALIPDSKNIQRRCFSTYFESCSGTFLVLVTTQENLDLDLQGKGPASDGFFGLHLIDSSVVETPEGFEDYSIGLCWEPPDCSVIPDGWASCSPE